MFVKQAATLATFSPGRMTKSDLVRGDFLFAGLNSFEPGQEHAPHTHEGQDKLYVVLRGAGEIRVGEQTELLTAGDVALAPSGVVHSIRNSGPARLVVMAVLAPPPGAPAQRIGSRKENVAPTPGSPAAHT
ncbi:MAG: cupin domain-containing protein [Acidobacteriota bacterium]